ncbi:MAG: hypothetical protein ACRDM0_18350, partial [Thermoleophilaceae bacterium]
MASQSATSSTRAPARNELLLDAAIAVVVFAAALGLLAVGESDAGGEIDALEVLAAAAASLPLVARRFAPLAVFVVTALGSAALYAIAEPAGPPIGPTLAVYWLAASGDGSRARTRLTLAVVAGLLAVH